jgi:hypothetical protein
MLSGLPEISDVPSLVGHRSDAVESTSSSEVGGGVISGVSSSSQPLTGRFVSNHSFAIGSGVECKYGCGAIMMLMEDIKIKKLE